MKILVQFTPKMLPPGTEFGRGAGLLVLFNFQGPRFGGTKKPPVQILGGEQVPLISITPPTPVKGKADYSVCPITQGVGKEGNPSPPPVFSFAKPSGVSVGRGEAQTPPPPASPVPEGGAVDLGLEIHGPGIQHTAHSSGMPRVPLLIHLLRGSAKPRVRT